MIAVSSILLLFALSGCDESIKPAAVALQQNDLSKAAAIIEAARSQCSGSAYFYELTGVINDLSGNSIAAEKAFQTAVSLQPKSSRLLSDLGIAYLRNKKPHDAKRVLEQALSLDPSDSRISYYLIGTYVELKDWPRALSFLDRLGPEHP